MRLHRGVLLVALLLVIVATAWLLRGDGEVESPAVPATPTTAAAPAAANPVTAPTVPEAGEAGDRQLVERLPAVAPAGADYAQGVRGIVVDRRGRPLAGADIYLVESAANDPLGRFLLAQRGVPLAPVAQGQSADDGTFALGLRTPTAKKHEVVLAAPHHAPTRIGDIQVLPQEWHDLGSVQLVPGVSVRGRVTIEGTELPVPQATVVVSAASAFADSVAQLGARQEFAAAVDAQGYYELHQAPRAGQFAVAAMAPGFARVTRTNLECSGDAPLEVDLQLPRGLTIAGTVAAPPGLAVPSGIQVEAWPLQGSEPPYLGADRGNGRFEVPGLREGNYRLRIQAQGFRPHVIDQVAAGRADLLVQLEPRAAASVRVLAPDGQLVRSYQLALRRFFAEGAGAIGVVADVPEQYVRLDGTTEVATLSGLDHGTYVFQVKADGFAKTLSKPFTIDATTLFAALEVTLSHGATLTGQVLDQQDRPLAGATVSTQADGADDDNPVWRMLAAATPDKISRTSVTTGPDGRFRLELLALADYQLAVTHPEHCPAWRRHIALHAEGEVVLPPLRLHRGAEVRGRGLIDGEPTGQIKIVVSNAADAVAADEPAIRVETVTNAAGEFVLPRRLPPGRYELRGALTVGSDPAGDILRQIAQLQQSAVPFTVIAGQETVHQELRLQSSR